MHFLYHRTGMNSGLLFSFSRGSTLYVWEFFPVFPNLNYWVMDYYCQWFIVFLLLFFVYPETHKDFVNSYFKYKPPSYKNRHFIRQCVPSHNIGTLFFFCNLYLIALCTYIISQVIILIPKKSFSFQCFLSNAMYRCNIYCLF